MSLFKPLFKQEIKSMNVLKPADTLVWAAEGGADSLDLLHNLPV